MFCKECGKELSDDSKFCATCGKKVEGEGPPISAKPTEDTPKEKVSSGWAKGCGIACVVVAILAVIAVVIGVCSNSSTPSTNKPTTYTIKYEVTGSATFVSLTYENEDGGTSQIDSASVPWTHTFTAEKGDFVYISAQNNGENGNVTANIYLNGTLVKTSTSSGAYVIATASGSV
jgi:hypothetical protein